MCSSLLQKATVGRAASSLSMESPPPVSFKHHLYAQAGFSLFARHVQVAFREGRHAEYVSRTLNVDHELKPHLIDRQITHSGPTLHM